MRRFNFAAVMVVGLLGVGRASAQTVTPVGWADDGSFVASYRDPVQAVEWAGGAEDFLARCAVTAIDGGLSCEVCKDLAACGISAKPKKLVKAKASPDKRFKLSDDRACTGFNNEPEECTRAIGLGAAGTLTLYESNPRKKGTLSVFFRPDSGAVALLLLGESPSDESLSIGDLNVIVLPPPPPPKKLDAKTVKAVALTVVPALKKCAEGSKAPGRINVRIVIESRGEVTEANMLNDAGFASSSAGECMLAAIVGLQFPVFTGKPMVVTLPFKL